MKDIRHVTRPISNSAILILCQCNEVSQLFHVDPMGSVDGDQRRKDPPAVADIWRLFRSTIEATTGRLSLAKPPTKAIHVYCM
eukprot:Skav201634  [mRNA]  locus=scaffold3582:222905:225337:+ [translate_table: standard]